MKNPNPYFLRNGLSVAFSDLGFYRSAFGVVSVQSFVVTLGGTLTLGAHELHELSAKLFSEVAQIADEIAHAENREELNEMRENRRWR